MVKSMSSIRSKLIRNILAIVILTIGILDLLTVIGLKVYYYKNIEKTLESQIDSSVNFYNKYFSSQTLLENIYDNIDSFWNNTELQVQILDSNGKLIMDSYGVRDDKILETPDIYESKKGKTGVWTGTVTGYDSEVMVVSKAITSNSEIIGIMRIIYSLEEIESIIKSFMILLIIISSVVIIVALIISLITANKIVTPLNKIIKVAGSMARGDLGVRCIPDKTIEIKQLANTLNYMATEIEKRDKLKNEFISSISHELRTPLTSIKGWAVTLNHEEMDRTTIGSGLNIIEEEADRLTEMVEELLDFSKLINGVISLKVVNCNLKEFIMHIEEYMAPRAIRESKNFNVIIENELYEGFLDKNRIKQVLLNVLDNAFKFTEENGEITLRVSRDKEKVYFIIEDDGCGIESDELPRVKEKFYKGRNSKSRNGIGLSISDEIIKLHNGEFYIESEYNKGTIITIVLPITVGGEL